MKRIKLDNLLHYIDPCCYLVIWYDQDDDEDKPSFEGCAMDVPYWLTKLYLSDPKNNDLDGTIDSRLVEKKSMLILIVGELK